MSKIQTKQIQEGNEGYILNVSGGTPQWGSLTNVLSNSGNCISDLYVSNIHSCSPLNINPNNEGNIYFGSASGFTVDLINDRVGVGQSSPLAKLHIESNGSTNTTTSLFVENSNNKRLFDIKDDGVINVNEDGLSTANFRIEGSNNTHLFFTNAFTNRVGINTSNPNVKFELKSDSISQEVFRITDSGNNANLRINSDGHIGVNLAPSSGVNGIGFDLKFNDGLTRHGVIIDTTGGYTGIAANTVLRILKTNPASPFQSTIGIEVSIDDSAGGSAVAIKTLAGLVIFQGLTEPNLFYLNDATDRIGIGNSSPASRLEVKGAGSTNTTTTFQTINSSNTNLFKVLDDGQVKINGGTSNNSAFEIRQISGKNNIINVWNNGLSRRALLLDDDGSTARAVLPGLASFTNGNNTLGEDSDFGYQLYSRQAAANKNHIAFVNAAGGGLTLRQDASQHYNLDFNSISVGTPTNVRISSDNDNWFLKNVGIGTTTPTDKLHINTSTGSSSTQFRLEKSFTPSSSGDTAGNVGSIAWDDNYFYQKTNTGWGRIAWDYSF